MKLCRLNLFSISLLTCLMIFHSEIRVYGDHESEFLQQLRQNGYLDLALYHLEQLKEHGRVPRSLQDQIEYERFKILLELARSTPVASKQSKLLEEADQALESFLNEHPGHPLFPEASSEKGRLLMEYARAEMKKVKKDDKGGSEFPVKARDYLKEARLIFERDLKRNEAAFKKFNLYIKPDEKEKRAQRDQAEQRYINSQYYEALCLYELSKTYESDPKEQSRLRDEAFKKFGDIYLRYRRVVVGLYSRMWQGKCYEDDHEYRKALGIYDELLSHPDQSPAVVNLQHQVLLFKLGCLNNNELSSFKEVVEEATARLKQYPDLAKTRTGLAIRWERALALKSLSDQKELSESNEKSYLRQSLDDVQQITQFPGEFRTSSVKLMDELNTRLGYQKKAGQSFSTALTDSKEMIEQIRSLQESIEEAQDEATRLNRNRELLAHLVETRKQLEMSISLADSKTDPSELNNLRYLLAYVYLLSGESEKAGVLSGFVGDYYRNETPTLALDSSYISAVSFLKAFETASGNKNSELDWVEHSAQRLIENWPEEKYSMEIALSAGKAFQREKQFIQATEFFAKVTPGSEYYSQAQMASGQAWWSAVLQALSDDSAMEKPDSNQIEKWKENAVKNLITGIKASEKQIKEGTSIPDELVIAKTILSQIYIRDQDYQAALEILTGGNYPVSEFMKNGPDPRPEKGPHSRDFTGYYYQLLLRCYVATRQIDESLEVMEQLDQLASGDQDSVTAIYVNLGKVIQKEIEQLVAENKTEQLKEIQNSFDQFLSELYERREQMNYGSLVWIAETYFGLASGLKGTDPEKTKQYSEKALNTYEAILGRSDVSQKNVLSIKLRQVKSLKLTGDFGRSYQFLTKLLEENQQFLDLQIEAATILEEWGDSGVPEKYVLAIKGDPPDKKGKVVWGWGEIARRTQRLLVESSQESLDESLQEKYWMSRFHVSSCREKYAISLSNQEDRKQMLELAKREIEVFASLTDKIPEDWVIQFNELYTKVCKNLDPSATKVAQLNWGEVISKNGDSTVAKRAAPVAGPVENSPKDRRPQTSFNMMTLAGSAIFALLILVIMVYFLRSSGKSKDRIRQIRNQPLKPTTTPAKRKVVTKTRKPDSQS